MIQSGPSLNYWTHDLTSDATILIIALQTVRSSSPAAAKPPKSSHLHHHALQSIWGVCAVVWFLAGHLHFGFISPNDHCSTSRGLFRCSFVVLRENKQTAKSSALMVTLIIKQVEWLSAPGCSNKGLYFFFPMTMYDQHKVFLCAVQNPHLDFHY